MPESVSFLIANDRREEAEALARRFLQTTFRRRDRRMSVYEAGAVSTAYSYARRSERAGVLGFARTGTNERRDRAQRNTGGVNDASL